MIVNLSIMIGCYIITRMFALFFDEDQSVFVGVLSIGTIIVTIIMVIGIVLSGSDVSDSLNDVISTLRNLD